MSDPGAGGLTALVLQQEALAPGGLVLDWLEERGIAATTARMDLGEEADLSGRDFVVALGSELSAYRDDVPLVGRELELLALARESCTPVLGICFGAQLLARSLGARCYRAARPEIGWKRVGSLDPGLVSDGPWFQWHFDTFDLPEGAELVAGNDVGPQAYVAGRDMGLQFHPEVTASIVRTWADSASAELGGESIEPAALGEETVRRLPEVAGRARALFDNWLTRVAGLAAPAAREAVAP